MATGVSGYVEFDSNVTWGKVRVYYSETYEVSTNKSKLTITSIQAKSTNWYGFTYYPDGVLKINGTPVYTFNSNIGDTLVGIHAQSTWYKIVDATDTSTPITASLDNIAHNTDGSKSISIQLTGNRFTGFRFFTISDKGGSGWYVDSSKTVALTTIPRASTLGATDANIGSNSAVAIDKKASFYTHSIKYEFGSLSGYVTSSGGVSTSEVKFSASSVSFKVPTSFYAQIPNAKTGKCKLTCTTYSGSTKIGDPQTTEFTVTAAESLCKPQVSGILIDSSSQTVNLTGDEYVLVKYFSDAACTISAEAKNSATIVKKKIGGVEVSGNSRTIFDVETNSVTFQATDSRGYSTQVTVKRAMVNYVRLTVNAQLARKDPTSGNALLQVKGNYFNDSFGQVDNTLEMWYRLAKSGESYGSWVQVFPTLDGNTYTLSVDLSGFDYLSSYSLQVRAEDKLTSKTITVTVSQGIPVVDWGKDDFRFNVPFLIPDSARGSTLPSTGKKGQVFFLRNSDGSYSIRIHDGTSW